MPLRLTVFSQLPSTAVTALSAHLLMARNPAAQVANLSARQKMGNCLPTPIFSATRQTSVTKEPIPTLIRTMALSTWSRMQMATQHITLAEKTVGQENQ